MTTMRRNGRAAVAHQHLSGGLSPSLEMPSPAMEEEKESQKNERDEGYTAYYAADDCAHVVVSMAVGRCHS